MRSVQSATRERNNLPRAIVHGAELVAVIRQPMITDGTKAADGDTKGQGYMSVHAPPLGADSQAVRANPCGVNKHGYRVHATRSKDLEA